jgi:2-polyprenyl-3-methyl-5-hydroxy-6-metoxy-1,4-benzoquinol methylase
LDLQELARHWEEFAKTDPLWAILINREKRGKRWRVEDFFKTGLDEINGIMGEVESMNLKIGRSRALDFGCGVGRLTRALADYFDEVSGVDISESMIRLAEKYNREISKCRFYLNQRDDLRLFGDGIFDFVYSSITLQHMESRYATKYLTELLRVVSPRGLLVFQLVEEQIGLKTLPNRSRMLAYKIRNRLANRPIMEMHGMQKKSVISTISNGGGKTLKVERLPDQGPGWRSYRYFVTK